MELRIVAIGRVGRSAEAELVDDYLGRAQKIARGAGISKISVLELDDRKLRDNGAEHRALADAVSGEAYWALDERGKVITSPQFSQQLIAEAGKQVQRLNILIGGADGLNDLLRQDARLLISFGKMVWPHMLARVMLSEQIYRALSIHSGHPYHRV